MCVLYFYTSFFIFVLNTLPFKSSVSIPHTVFPLLLFPTIFPSNTVCCNTPPLLIRNLSRLLFSSLSPYESSFFHYLYLRYLHSLSPIARVQVFHSQYAVKHCTPYKPFLFFYFLIHSSKIKNNVHDKSQEQASGFHYLGCEISITRGTDADDEVKDKKRNLEQ